MPGKTKHGRKVSLPKSVVAMAQGGGKTDRAFLKAMQKAYEEAKLPSHQPQK